MEAISFVCRFLPGLYLIKILFLVLYILNRNAFILILENICIIVVLLGIYIDFILTENAVQSLTCNFWMLQLISLISRLKSQHQLCSSIHSHLIPVGLPHQILPQCTWMMNLGFTCTSQALFRCLSSPIKKQPSCYLSPPSAKAIIINYFISVGRRAGGCCSPAAFAAKQNRILTKRMEGVLWHKSMKEQLGVRTFSRNGLTLVWMPKGSECRALHVEM